MTATEFLDRAYHDRMRDPNHPQAEGIIVTAGLFDAIQDEFTLHQRFHPEVAPWGVLMFRGMRVRIGSQDKEWHIIEWVNERFREQRRVFTEPEVVDVDFS